MKELLDSLILRFGFLDKIPVELVYLAGMIFFGLILLFVFVALVSGFNTYLERRISGRMQSRIGCNRVGPEGILQFVTDGLKLIMKEDIIPGCADKPLFRLAPYLVFMGCFMGFAVIPYAKGFVLSDLNIGIFYVMSVASVAVVGVLMSGWSSNNKWALLGAVRSTAQIVSYEIPAALSLLVPVLLASTMNMTSIVEAQRGGIQNWFINPFVYPFGFIAGIIFFVASLSETNRTPFDLPEAESELVAGYNTEYSGMRFAIFFVAEYANIFLSSAIFATTFLGGYSRSILDIVFGTVAGFFVAVMSFKSASYGINFIKNVLKDPKDLFMHLNNSQPFKFPLFLKIFCWVSSFIITLAAYMFSEGYLFSFVFRIFFFMSKVFALIFLIMWLRWTLPRFRVDQLMSLCWKKLVPIAFLAVLGTAFLMVI